MAPATSLITMIDDQPRLVTTGHIRLSPQGCFQRRAVPDPCADKMVQPAIVERVCPCGHGLDAFAIARADQTGDIGWAHLTSRPVAQILQIWLKPALEIVSSGMITPQVGIRGASNALASTLPAVTVTSTRMSTKSSGVPV